jgi:hypothetical protein
MRGLIYLSRFPSEGELYAGIPFDHCLFSVTEKLVVNSIYVNRIMAMGSET